jgi:hypothetical protein
MTPKNPWKHVKVDPARLENNRFLNPTEPVPPTPSVDPVSEPITGAYILMPKTTTEVQGIHALRKACEAESNSAHPQFPKDDGSLIYRPLTFRETIQARVDDFNIEQDDDGNDRDIEDRLRFFNKWLDSCTGIGYKAKTKKFKLASECSQLIEITSDFADAFLPTLYNQIQGVELDSGKRGVKYGELLTETEVNGHEAWINAVGDDQEGKDLLREYTGIVFSQLKRKYDQEYGMCFWVVQNPAKDQLRALYVSSLYNYSIAYGDSNLDSVGSFLRVAQERTP